MQVSTEARPRYQRNLVRPGNRVSGPSSFLARDAQDACEIAVEVDAKVFSPLPLLLEPGLLGSSSIPREVQVTGTSSSAGNTSEDAHLLDH